MYCNHVRLQRTREVEQGAEQGGIVFFWHLAFIQLLILPMFLILLIFFLFGSAAAFYCRTDALHRPALEEKTGYDAQQRILRRVITR
jgi:hypothetical protein